MLLKTILSTVSPILDYCIYLIREKSSTIYIYIYICCGASWGIEK